MVFEGKVILGWRNNQPLKGRWFTPSGRGFKYERYQDCLLRVPRSEIGFVVQDLSDFNLMGAWGHFYENSAIDENISTHYVDLSDYCCLKETPKLWLDKPHEKAFWLNLEK